VRNVSSEEKSAPSHMYPMEMISHCRLHGMDKRVTGIDCKDMFYPTITDHGRFPTLYLVHMLHCLGICASFNALALKEVMKPSPYLDTFARVFDVFTGAGETIKMFGSGQSTRMDIVINSFRSAMEGNGHAHRG